MFSRSLMFSRTDRLLKITRAKLRGVKQKFSSDKQSKLGMGPDHGYVHGAACCPSTAVLPPSQAHWAPCWQLSSAAGLRGLLLWQIQACRALHELMDQGIQALRQQFMAGG